VKRYLLPYPVYRFIGDRIVGKFLLYGFKRELARGDNHEARHIAALIQVGNSQPCNGGEPCLLEGGTFTVPTSIHSRPETEADHG
jgi:hypothetical protein